MQSACFPSISPSVIQGQFPKFFLFFFRYENDSELLLFLEAKYMMLDDLLIILQHIKTSEFRVCLKELFADQHDPVNVSYTVLAGLLVNDKNKFSLRRPSQAQQTLVVVN